MDDDDYERLMQRKQKALELLAPFGFEDNNDGDGTIWHAATGQVFDISATDPTKIIQVVFARGVEVGELNARQVMRKAIGL